MKRAQLVNSNSYNTLLYSQCVLYLPIWSHKSPMYPSLQLHKLLATHAPFAHGGSHTTKIIEINDTMQIVHDHATILGCDSSCNISKSISPCIVLAPISKFPLTAISNLQNLSSPHISLALSSNSWVANVASNIGTKSGS